MSTINETCPCGAEFAYTGPAPHAAVEAWRAHHVTCLEPRCTCPVGFGAVVATNCPRHGVRNPKHTITGAFC